MLQLNADKTELMVFGAKQILKQMGSFVIHIGDCEIKPTHRIKNLGVFYDPVMSMETHVNHVCKIAYMHIRNIGHIRRYLSEDATKSLVHAIVMSRMDYGNALLFGLPDYLTYRLQKVQNLCARIITFTPRRCHISPVLQSLHWLPIKRWLEYKVLLHTYKGLNGLAPGYLADMLEPYRPTRTLRSHDQQLLIVKPSKFLSRWAALSYILGTAKSNPLIG